MTQAQLDLQNQLEQTENTDLTTQPLFNDSPVLFLDAMDQTPSVANSEQSSSSAQIEHQNPPEKHPTPPEEISIKNIMEHLPQIIMNNLLKHLYLQKTAMREKPCISFFTNIYNNTTL